MTQCEYIIPKQEEVEEHQCPRPAEAVSVSQEQMECTYKANGKTMHGWHWVETGRVAYCLTHAVPGTVRLLDGTTSVHPIMSI